MTITNFLIATNTPASFTPAFGYEFTHLGDRTSEANIIVIMLENKWGSKNIESINNLTQLISTYPTKTPCFIIGCESPIPDKNFKKYLMKDRDSAILNLCNSVLNRSKSIGVRGEITHLYLTEILHLRQDQVDIIYDKETDDNLELITEFLNKNKCPLKYFIKEIHSFQKKPAVFYERPQSYEKEIYINKPYITNSDEASRINSDVIIDGKKITLWCETSKVYSHYFLVERSDAFLCAILPLAMRTGKDIVCEAPVTEQFLHNLREILIPQLSTHDSRLYKSLIRAHGDSSTLLSGNANATGMSCGVDSFYTTLLYTESKYRSMNLTHLYTGNYLYGNTGKIYERAQSVANELDLPLVSTATNINEALGLPHLFTHFYKTMFGVLSLRKLFKTYYYSTAEDFSFFTLEANSTNSTVAIELLNLYCFTCSDFQVVTGGVKSERAEKTQAISSFATAQKFLNVCLYPEKDINCGTCVKCLRTLLSLDMAGSLELFSEVFNINEYKKSRLNNFVYLVEQKNSIMLSDVFDYFKKKEPELISKAEKIINSRIVN